MSPRTIRFNSLEGWLITILFVASLGFNLWAVSVGWKSRSLWGYEFRQTQTAISAVYIQKENNFALAYPTPVLGKPWSVPFEFPLYQWTAVVVSNTTHLSLIKSGRLVGVVCFYLGLPALYLLLRRIGLAGPQRLVVLILVLTCPLYIFYSRAFLIETMALMFGLWYLLALIEAVERRSPWWLVLASVAGAGAGLVKVTTFIVFVLPAFGCSLWWLWQARPRNGVSGWAPFSRILGWLAAAHALPFAATLWWLRFSDAVKSLNPSGAGLTSAKLKGFNFGYGHHFDRGTWTEWWAHITQDITAPLTLLVATMIALLFPGRWWRHALACIGLFLGIQLLFPVLYLTHGYYYVANAFLLLAAIGLALGSLLEDARMPRGVVPLIIAGLCFVQGRFYLQHHYPLQKLEGDRGGLASALRELTEPDESIVVAGGDWSSILPYYAERRALMIRNGLPERPDYLRTAFASMQGERVGALVLMGPQRDNTALLTMAIDAFDLDTRPVFTWRHEDQSAVVYLSRQARPNALTVFARRGFHEVTLLPAPDKESNPLVGREYAYGSLLPRYQRLFHIISPRPVRFFSTFGPELWNADMPGQERYAANPSTKLWFQLAPGLHRVRTDLDIPAAAWQDVPAPDASDGVEIVVAALYPDGRYAVLQQRYFNPRLNPADRGLQPIDWTVDLPAGAELELNVNAGPQGNGARDWATLGYLTID